MDPSNTYAQPPDAPEPQTPDRVSSSYYPFSTYKLPPAEKRHYANQFADLYFARLALLKRQVEKIVRPLWDDYHLGTEKARRCERVLDVRQGQLCWIVGTVFVKMRLKQNVMDDLAHEEWIVAPQQLKKYVDTTDNSDRIMLEDESGRLPLTGPFLDQYRLCTGCIVGVLGTENSKGLFEVIDVRAADLPKQPPRWFSHNSRLAALSEPTEDGKKAKGKIAIVSGLLIDGASSHTLALDMLREYLLGQTGDGKAASNINRLIIAGNAFNDNAPIPQRDHFMKLVADTPIGTDPDFWNPSPPEAVDRFLATILPSIPVTIIPGESDPTSVALPQQPLHMAMFPRSRRFTKHPTDTSDTPSWFDSVTNPWDGEIDGWRVLATGGQIINDMSKYFSHPNRLALMENVLRWRNVAPTAPDTLWSYPYQEDDPLVLRECPHIFIAGNQPKAKTKIIKGPNGQEVRLLCVPSFHNTGAIVLLDSETSEVETVSIGMIHPKSRGNSASKDPTSAKRISPFMANGSATKAKSLKKT